MKTAILTVLLSLSCLWGNAQTTTITERLTALELKVSMSGDYLKKYHTERKRALVFGGFFMGVGQIPLWTGIKQNEPIMEYIGYGTVGVGFLYLIGQTIAAERWMKKAGIELSGNGVKFLF